LFVVESVELVLEFVPAKGQETSKLEASAASNMKNVDAAVRGLVVVGVAVVAAPSPFAAAVALVVVAAAVGIGAAARPQLREEPRESCLILRSELSSGWSGFWSYPSIRWRASPDLWRKSSGFVAAAAVVVEQQLEERLELAAAVQPKQR